MRACRPPARDPRRPGPRVARQWQRQRRASASSPASIIPVGPPPAITTACCVIAAPTSKRLAMLPHRPRPTASGGWAYCSGSGGGAVFTPRRACSHGLDRGQAAFSSERRVNTSPHRAGSPPRYVRTARDSFPSTVTTVQPSGSVLTSRRPSLSIGSIVKTIPSAGVVLCLGVRSGAPAGLRAFRGRCRGRSIL